MCLKVYNRLIRKISATIDKAMASKFDDGEDGKYSDDGKEDKDYIDDKDSKDTDIIPPRVDITGIDIRPSGCVDISSPLKISIKFELDRDVVAAFWKIQFLVDSTNTRIIKVLGETEVEDYPDGESDMNFSVKSIDISGISPSALTNSGLLMAVFVADGEEVVSVNMVCCSSS